MVKPWNWKGQQCCLADIRWPSGISTRRRNIVMWERQVSTKPIRAAGKRRRNASSYNKAPDKICSQTHVGYPLEKHGNTGIKEIFRQWAALMAVGEITYHRRQNPEMFIQEMRRHEVEGWPWGKWVRLDPWSKRNGGIAQGSLRFSLSQKFLSSWDTGLSISKKDCWRVWSKPLKIISYFLGDLKSLHKPLFFLTPTILVFEGKTES